MPLEHILLLARPSLEVSMPAGYSIVAPDGMALRGPHWKPCEPFTTAIMQTNPNPVTFRPATRPFSHSLKEWRMQVIKTRVNRQSQASKQKELPTSQSSQKTRNALDFRNRLPNYPLWLRRQACHSEDPFQTGRRHLWVVARSYRRTYLGRTDSPIGRGAMR